MLMDRGGSSVRYRSCRRCRSSRRRRPRGSRLNGKCPHRYPVGSPRSVESTRGRGRFQLGDGRRTRRRAASLPRGAAHARVRRGPARRHRARSTCTRRQRAGRCACVRRERDGNFGVSSLFHRGRWEPTRKRWVGLLDHAMIYVLIAGTYTPFALLVLRHGWRTPILTAAWGGALLARC
jgi:hypothetical protein